ncbi:MAG TPA: CAP domain-containing protein [Acidimicrobiales bacterium]|nr:CAP domain-containing protein [Acidimicrobiales bacterium]
MLKRILFGAVAALVFAVVPRATAGASPSPAWYVVQNINAYRATYGLAPLAIQTANLQAAAEAWDENLVRANALGHNPDLMLQAPPGATTVGENVGVGPTVSSVELGFDQSAEHRANLLSPYFTMVGVAVIRSPYTGQVFITEDFAN